MKLNTYKDNDLSLLLSNDYKNMLKARKYELINKNRGSRICRSREEVKKTSFLRFKTIIIIYLFISTII